MIGIYQIKNKTNGKLYIGQSSDIYRRWEFYFNPPEKLGYNSSIISAIKKYGVDEFKFSILEECLVEELNEKEVYYIKLYNTTNREFGYNLTAGGDHNIGESNPRAKLNENDVKLIRSIYDSKTKERKEEIYKRLFSDKVGIRGFQKVWAGETWRHIYMYVYTSENKEYYNKQAKGHVGQRNSMSLFTDEQVMEARNRYVNELGRDIYEDYKEFYSSYSGFEKMLLGSTYSHLPIYKKREKKWINC